MRQIGGTYTYVSDFFFLSDCICVVCGSVGKAEAAI